MPAPNKINPNQLGADFFVCNFFLSQHSRWCITLLSQSKKQHLTRYCFFYLMNYSIFQNAISVPLLLHSSPTSNANAVPLLLHFSLFILHSLLMHRSCLSLYLAPLFTKQKQHHNRRCFFNYLYAIIKLTLQTARSLRSLISSFLFFICNL